jgi:cation diffusion facilitator family transporter
MNSVKKGLRTSGVVFFINIVLAVSKVAAGIFGNSYALVADGIESTADSVTAMIVWIGLRISARPPDSTHPYGHGKAESIAALVVSLFVLGAAGLIAFQSVRGISSPQHTPAPYTLLVLVAVIVIKEIMFRKIHRIGDEIHSGALKSDAWHHRSDAITSLAAFIGISIALIGGEGYEVADDWAALAACLVIAYNGTRLVFVASNDIMDAAPPQETQDAVRRIAKETDGVVDVEKCRVRKSGLGLLLDIHVVVDGDITVRRGHDIAHQVQNRLHRALPEIRDVVVHIEPHDL